MALRLSSDLRVLMHIDTKLTCFKDFVYVPKLSQMGYNRFLCHTSNCPYTENLSFIILILVVSLRTF